MDPAANAQLYSNVLRLVASTGVPEPALLARTDSVLRDDPPYTFGDLRGAMNLIVARSWERAGNAGRAAAAAERTRVWELSGTLAGTAGLRDIGRLKLAAGDTVGAVRAWRDYLMARGQAEPSQRKIDDEIRKKLGEIARKKG